MDRLEEQLFQRLLDTRHAAASQVCRQVAVLAPGVILYLADVEEDMALICAKLDVHALLVQFLAVANILQARHVVAQDAVIVLLRAQRQAIAEDLLHQPALSLP